MSNIRKSPTLASPLEVGLGLGLMRPQKQRDYKWRDIDKRSEPTWQVHRSAYTHQAVRLCTLTKKYCIGIVIPITYQLFESFALTVHSSRACSDLSVFDFTLTRMVIEGTCSGEAVAES
jgi:hypothetical protein